MSEVTGQIGNDQVYLENAATEATLQLLLKATLATTKAQKEAIADIAEKSGLDSQSIANANRETNVFASSARGVARTLGVIAGISQSLGSAFQSVIGFAEKLANNEGKTSAVFESLNFLPFGIGKVMDGFAALQRIQEQQLEAYQQMTASGTGFAGNLDQIRMTAGRLNLTLPQFAELMAKNGEYLSKFGGSVTEGSRAFVRISADLNNGPTGRALRGLGYTSEQINDHLMKYIAISGGRSKDELRNTQKITQQTAAYLKELDRLAQITGRSREELEKQLEAQSLEANWQLFLGNLESSIPGVSDRLTGALNTWTGLFGEAGGDIIKASAMNMQAQSEGAQKIAQLSPQTYAYLQQYGKAVRDGTMSSEELRIMQLKIRQQWAADAAKLGNASGAFNRAFDEIQVAGRQAAKDLRMKNLKDMDEVDKKIRAEQAAREGSSAAAQADLQVQNLQMANQIMAMLLDLNKELAPYMSWTLATLKEFLGWLRSTGVPQLKDFMGRLGAWWKESGQQIFTTFGAVLKDKVLPALGAVASWILEHPKLFASLAGAVLLTIGAFKVAQAALAVKNLVTGFRGGGPAGGGGPGGGGPAGGGGGGAFGASMGKSISNLGKGIGEFAKYVGKGVGAVFTEVGKGIGNFGSGLGKFMSTAGKGVGAAIKGIMTGLAAGASALGKPQALLGLGAFTLAMMGIGKALEWASPFMKEAAPVLEKIAEVVGGVLIAAIQQIDPIIRGFVGAVGDLVTKVGESVVTVFTGIVAGLERLAVVGGGNLLGIAAGIGALGVALMPFTIAGALGGLVAKTGLLEDLARGISALGAVDGSNLGNVGRGLAEFVNNLPDLVDAGTAFLKLGALSSNLEDIGKGLQSIASSNPANLTLLLTFVNTMIASKFGKDGIIIFTDKTVGLMKQFTELALKANIDQIVRLKDVAIKEIPTATANIDKFNTSLGNLLKADVVKIKELATAIGELKTSMALDPGQDTSAIETVIQKIFPETRGGTTGGGTDSGPYETNVDLTGDINQVIERGLEQLNSNIGRLLNISNDIENNTRRVALKASRGDLFS